MTHTTHTRGNGSTMVKGVDGRVVTNLPAGGTVPPVSNTATVSQVRRDEPVFIDEGVRAELWNRFADRCADGMFFTETRAYLIEMESDPQWDPDLGDGPGEFERAYRVTAVSPAGEELDALGQIWVDNRDDALWTFADANFDNLADALDDHRIRETGWADGEAPVTRTVRSGGAYGAVEFLDMFADNAEAREHHDVLWSLHQGGYSDAGRVLDAATYAAQMADEWCVYNSGDAIMVDEARASVRSIAVEANDVALCGAAQRAYGRDHDETLALIREYGRSEVLFRFPGQ